MDNLQQIDDHIRSGDHQKAKRLLYRIRPSDVGREHLVQLSDFGRRINNPIYSVKIMNKIVRAHLEENGALTTAETISYSRALIKLGFFQESLKWLSKIDSQGLIEVNDIKGRLYMHQWAYAKSIHFFNKYISHLEKGTYPYLVAGLNLSAGLVFVKKYSEANELLENLIHYSKQGNHNIILANAYELLGQNYVYQKMFSKAFQSFELSRNYLGSRNNIYHFYTRKWQWVIRILSEKVSQELLLQGKALKAEAQKSFYWEDIREIDRYLAEGSGDLELAQKLYFGTSHIDYQNLIKNEFFKNDLVPSHYLWKLKGDARSSLSIEIDSSKLPPTLHKLFDCLTHDFYRPLSMGYVASHLNPDEYFDPFSTTNRLYNNVKRLRTALPDCLNIKWSDEGIKLDASKACTIPVNSHRKQTSKLETRIQLLRGKVQKKWFSCSEASKVLNMSSRSALRTINEAKEKYAIESTGNGKAKRYRFAG